MNDILKIKLIPLFLILCPVLMIGTHFINLSEFYLYGVFLLNYKKLSRNDVAIIFFRYGITFLGVIIFTSFLSGKLINNHDIFILRNCAQLGIGILLFQYYLDNIKLCLPLKDVEKELFKVFILLSIPVFIVFFQRLNIFGMRDIVLTLYRPKFHFLGAEVFSEYRYTSVFKDFFSSAVYYIALSLGLFILAIKSSLIPIKKMILLVLVFLTFLSQIYVSRTGLVFIPLICAVVFILARKNNRREQLKSFAIVAVSFIPLYFVFTRFILSTLDFNQDWITEESSFIVMQNWYERFFSYVVQNPGMIFRPIHEYGWIETSNSNLYSDSFYVQETFRYGIYGILAYLYLCVALLIHSRKNNVMVGLLTLVLMALNYKGGNVFFMPKIIYLLSFIFVFISFYHKKEEGVA